MSARESRLDVCPECKKVESDTSEKKLFECPTCKRWFCERHFEPKVATIRNLNAKMIRDKEWRAIVEKDMERKDGHPDFAYTERRYNDLQKEKEIYRKRFGQFIERLSPNDEAIQKEMKREKPLFKEQFVSCPKCGSARTMTTAYRKEFETFECLSCHHKWKSEISYRLIPVQPKTSRHKVRNAVLAVSLLMVLLIVLALFFSSPELGAGIFTKRRFPTASFVTSKTTDIFTGETILFNASSSYDPDNSQGKGISTYRWNFGDGNPIETVSRSAITHSYASVRSYNVTLTVIDDDGQNAECVRKIEVSWEVPPVFQLKNWLMIDKTDEMTYHDPDFVCLNFSEMLASHSRQEDWRMALVLIYGYDTTTLQTWNHAINAINTTEGLVYIEPQTDEVWWLSNHAQMVSGNTYSFWSYPYQTIHVHINDILVIYLEDLDKYHFGP